MIINHLQLILYGCACYWVSHISFSLCADGRLTLHCYFIADTIPMITDHRSYSRRQLQGQLINAKCFTSIISSMTMVADISSNQDKVRWCSLFIIVFLIVGLNNASVIATFSQDNKVFEQLCCRCLKAVTAILRNNENAKDLFASIIGYEQFARTIERLCPINRTILQELLSMVNSITIEVYWLDYSYMQQQIQRLQPHPPPMSSQIQKLLMH